MTFFAILPGTSSAAIICTYDLNADGIYYELNGSEATVTYYGFNSSNGTIVNNYSGIITIPETVTSNGTTYIVTSIGSQAFYGCTGLTSITFPNSITSIGFSAFSGCTGLNSINIPNSVMSIGSSAFSRCTELTYITIPQSISYIGEDAFWNTPWYNNQPDGVVYIGLIAYKYKGTMPSGTSIILKEGTHRIAPYAFRGCTGLSNITIPNSVSTIDDLAFESCKSLTSLRIPKSVNSIASTAFIVCNNLNSITVDNENPFYDSRNNCNAIIESNTNTISVGCKNTIIPNGIISIGDYAFYNCVDLVSIDIPNSVTLIGNRAFENCIGLTNVIIPNSVTMIAWQAFAGCSNLTSITIPNSVTSIGNYAFYRCENLTVANLSGDGEWVAGEISNTLTKIYIDDGITAIKNLNINPTDVYCFANVPPICNDSSFNNYTGTLHIPATSLAAYFTAPYWCNFYSIVGDAIIPNEISISKEYMDVVIDDEFKLIASILPNNASINDIIWISSNANIASVNNGSVKAVGCGECDIIASCFGLQAICHIVVYNGRILMDQQDTMVLPNHIITLTPSVIPQMPENFFVTSSDPSVAAARVMNGKVQVVGIKEGTTTITVGSADGTAIPATCLVTVYTEPGDLNCDGFINIGDVTSIIDYLLSDDGTQISTKNADVNGDGNINIADVTTLIDILLREE